MMKHTYTFPVFITFLSVSQNQTGKIDKFTGSKTHTHPHRQRKPDQELNQIKFCDEINEKYLNLIAKLSLEIFVFELRKESDRIG